MRAVDSNVLVYAFSSESKFHDQASTAITELASGKALWAIPWACIHEFYSTVTHRALFPHPDRSAQARAQIAEWMRSPSLKLLSESREHWHTLERLITSAGITGPMIHDAKIAAICLDHGVTELLTFDRDFARFPDLKVRSIRD